MRSLPRLDGVGIILMIWATISICDDIRQIFFGGGTMQRNIIAFGVLSETSTGLVSTGWLEAFHSNELTLRINEIISQPLNDYGGRDAIELYNYGTEPISVAGWKLVDENANQFVFPSKYASLNAGDFLLLYRDDEESFTFGLGKSDSLTLFNPNGQLVDTTTWTKGQASSGTSWGRQCNDKDEIFGTLTTISLGAPNICSTKFEGPRTLLLNEIATASPNDVGGDDWIELYNYGEDSIDLNKWKLFLSLEKYSIQDEINLNFISAIVPAGSFSLLDVDTLGSSVLKLYDRGTIVLKDPASKIVDSLTWVSDHAPIGKSFGRQENTRIGILKCITPCATNVCDSSLSGPTTVWINEVFADGNFDWIEFYNYGSQKIHLSGWTFTDKNGENLYEFLHRSILLPNDYVVVQHDGYPMPFVFDSVDSVFLYDPYGNLVDAVHWGKGQNVYNYSWGRQCDTSLGIPVGSLPIPTRGTANKCDWPTYQGPLTLLINEVGNEDQVYWIELYNYGTESIHLEGWSLMDSQSNMFFIRTRTPIAIGGYFLLGKDENFTLTLNLKQRSDRVSLFSPSASYVHSLEWAEKMPDLQSFGHFCDEKSSIPQSLKRPTPGFSNECSDIQVIGTI